jgi:putative addiction module killer protein
VTRLTIREYVAADGRSPYRTWIDGLDLTTRARIQARVLRFEAGNLGDHKSLGDGLWEARVMFGPGYRVYFSRHAGTLILLLAGGDKSGQSRDIGKARRHLADYLKAVRHGKT